MAILMLSPVPSSTAGTATSVWSLLPQPATAIPDASGLLRVSDGATVAVRGATDLQATVHRFLELIAVRRGLRLRVASPTEANPLITFDVDPNASVVDDSGYRMAIDAKGIRITARSAAGAFYGSVTLWQLLTPPGWTQGSTAEIATGVIEDHARFPWRAVMLDSGRHFQRVADIEKLIDWMSLDKLNVLVWHLTEDQGWRLEVPKYPELTRTGACRQAVGLDIELTGSADKPYCGFYTQADVREVVRYAAARFVTVVPEFDIPGHSQAAVSAYPWLGVTGKRPPVWTDWGISPWLLKPDEKTLRFVNDVLDELMQLFPSPYISIGGDEADKQQWNASPELNAQLQRLGLANMDQLQGWFTRQVADYLVSKGRRPVGWDDELMAGVALPGPEVVMSWHGDHGQHVALEAARQGHDVVLTPTDSLYFDYYQSDLPDEWTGQPPMSTLQQAYDTPMTPTGATAAEASHVIGVQGNLWTELTPTFAHDQHALYPRVAALSEVGWSQEKRRDWKGFLPRLSAELSRYRALGIAFADSAFAPAFAVAAGRNGMLRVAISNQTDFGEIRYTTDGSAPGSTSTLYAVPVELPSQSKGLLRAATFAPGGFELASPRAQVLDASTLLSQAGSSLVPCSSQPGSRLEGSLTGAGSRPVYKLNIGDMCWLWHRARLAGIGHVELTVERLPWRFGDEAKDAVLRPKVSAAGEFQVHVNSCKGPLFATFPLTASAGLNGQIQIRAAVSGPRPDVRDLCVIATGDPRDGQWGVAQMRLSH